MLERTTSRLRFSHRRIPRAGAVDQSSVPLPSRRGESGSQRADGPVRWVRIHRRAHGSRRTLLHATPTQMDIYVAILSFFCFTKPGEYKHTCVLLKILFLCFCALLRLIFHGSKFILLWLFKIVNLKSNYEGNIFCFVVLGEHRWVMRAGDAALSAL